MKWLYALKEGTMENEEVCYTREVALEKAVEIESSISLKKKEENNGNFN